MAIPSPASICLEAFINDAEADSDWIEDQILVHLCNHVVPHQDTVLLGYLLDSLVHELSDLLKMPAIIKISKKDYEAKQSTYVLPIATCLGFMSAALKAAKKSSIGHPL